MIALNPRLTGFRCTRCGALRPAGPATYACPADGANLDAEYDFAAIAREVDPYRLAADPNRSAWHYAPLLPLFPAAGEGRDWAAPWAHPLWSHGWTPLYRAAGLERRLGARAMWLKDDGRLPSCSFKDRASAMVVAQALREGASTICAASTGNAAASLAALCAGTGLRAVIFVPDNAPEAKLAQILIHGARVYAVRGSYDDAFELALRASREFGWLNRNTGHNPHTREGKKTAAYEMCEQLAAAEPGGVAFRAPDAVVVPVGDGNILSGLHKGFKDLRALGWIARLPRLYGVSAALAPALGRAWRSGGERIEPAPASTLAGGISADLPRDGVMALRAMRETGGALVEAGDEEMLEAMGVLARQAAVFVEPSAAAALAGLGKLRQSGAIGPGDEVVLQLTGSGLKDARSAMRAAGRPIEIEGRLDEVRLENGD
jgi:threonine synthase